MWAVTVCAASVRWNTLWAELILGVNSTYYAEHIMRNAGLEEAQHNPQGTAAVGPGVQRSMDGPPMARGLDPNAPGRAGPRGHPQMPQGEGGGETQKGRSTQGGQDTQMKPL